MYLTYKQNSCFPGPLPEAPDGDDNNVSIHAILHCLGVIPNTNDFIVPSESQGVSENSVLDPERNSKSNDDATIIV
jgi:hypothetical protein